MVSTPAVKKYLSSSTSKMYDCPRTSQWPKAFENTRTAAVPSPGTCLSADCVFRQPTLLGKGKGKHVRCFSHEAAWLQPSETGIFWVSRGHGFITGEVLFTSRKLCLKSTWITKKAPEPSFIRRAGVHTPPGDTGVPGLERTPQTVKLHPSPALYVQQITIVILPQFSMTPTLSSCVKSHQEIRVQGQ